MASTLNPESIFAELGLRATINQHLDEIREIWTEYPDANIAIEPASIDCLVLDFDPNADETPIAGRTYTHRRVRTPRGFHEWFSKNPYSLANCMVCVLRK